MSGTFVRVRVACSRMLLFAALIALVGVFFQSAAEAAFNENTKKILAEVFVLYQSKAYAKAYERLGKITQRSREVRGEKAYWRGLLLARQQKFKEAIVQFRQAKRYGVQKKELPYELGQALYAVQDLRAARQEFMLAIKRRYKRAVSAYYSGYISQTIDEYAKAKYFYTNTLKLEDKEAKKVHQPIMLQLAEMEMDVAESMHDQKVHENDREEIKEKLDKEFTEYVHKNIIPSYEKVVDYDDDSDAGKYARKRIGEIKRKWKKEIPKMRNGVPIPRKRGQIKYTPEVGYDSNVISRADDTPTAISRKDSSFLKQSFYARAQFQWMKMFSFSPTMSAYYTRYFRRHDPEIYRFDTVSISPSLKNKFEHDLNGKQATLIFDIDANYTARDRERLKQMKFFTGYTQFTIGERVLFWKNVGKTTFQADVKFFRSATTSRNAITTTLKVKQTIKYLKSRQMQVSLGVNRRRAQNDFNDQQQILSTLRTSFKNLFWKVDFTPNIGLTLTDPLKQKAARGNELTLTSGLKVERRFGTHVTPFFNWSFLRTWSRDEANYELAQHKFSVGIAFSN